MRTAAARGLVAGTAILLVLLADVPRVAPEVGSPPLRKLILMGGSASAGGHVTPVAEANVWGDPEAADIESPFARREEDGDESVRLHSR